MLCLLWTFFIETDFPTQLRAVRQSWFSFRNERWGAMKTFMINSKSSCEPGCLLTSSNSRPSCSPNQPRIWASVLPHSRSTIHHHRTQILSLEHCRSLCRNESHHLENSYPFAPLPSVCWSAIHPWLQTFWSLPIISSERQAYFQQDQRTLFGNTFSYYSCLRSAAAIHFLRICFNSSGAFWLTSKTSVTNPLFSSFPLSSWGLTLPIEPAPPIFISR